MNVKRFTARSSREALAMVRQALGEDAIVLSTKPSGDGVEVLAMAPESMQQIERMATDGAPAASPALSPAALASQTRPAAPGAARQRPSLASRTAAMPMAAESLAESSVDDDVARLNMSTLSFQDYVRERMLRRRHEALEAQKNGGNSSSAEAATPAPAPRVPAPAPAAKPARAEANPGAKPAAPRKAATAAPVAPVTAIAAPAPKASEGLVDELHAMKTLIEDRFNTLTWLGQARQNPIQSNLMLKLIRSGYSPTLARTILERMPEDVGAAESLRWVMAVLERNLKTDARSRPLIQEGGTYALVGGTGVGKTTTAAKLAGLCARAHGPASVGLITLDTYRVGGHDQLRAFGRMLGVVAHLAHDQAALQDLQIA